MKNTEKDILKIVDPSAEITDGEKAVASIALKKKLQKFFNKSNDLLKDADKRVDTNDYINSTLPDIGMFATGGIAGVSAVVFALSMIVGLGAGAAGSIWPEIEASLSGNFYKIWETTTWASMFGAFGFGLSFFGSAITDSPEMSLGTILTGLITVPPMLLAKLGIKTGKGITSVGKKIMDHVNNNETENEKEGM